MKTVSLVTSVLAVLTLTLSPTKAQVTYIGPGTANGGGGSGEGISSVVINNTASDITFTINTSAAQSAYVQYYVLLQYVGQGASGSTALFNSAGALNGWGPSLGISTGMNAFAATWNTGASAETYTGGVWTQNAAVSYDAGGTGFNYVTFTVPLSSLGLSLGSQFYFDVASSYPNSAGQSAYGSLLSSYPAETDNSYHDYTPGQNAYDAATDAGGAATKFGTAADLYTVVPEPVTSAFLGLGALLLILRRRVFSAR
ncbi:MAG TPA: PEP-CTERM sorting domain-containing protein [Verrucomicrobiae bacterium]|nr:PEP-CTERM sorting domain-containing protein [Verrucomicrobiae bacterium]